MRKHLFLSIAVATALVGCSDEQTSKVSTVHKYDGVQTLNLGNVTFKQNVEITGDKAIEIVLKDLGIVNNGGNVYYNQKFGYIIINCEGQDNKGRYIVSVRSFKTTETIYFYYVDVITGRFEVEG